MSLSKLCTALTWLANQRTARLSEQITICDDALTCTLGATVGQTELQSEDNQGFTTLFTSTDFMVRPTDLLIAGRITKPRAGMKIRRTLDGVTNIYEVLPPPGKKNYRDADPFRKTYRIHTKLVGTEPA